MDPQKQLEELYKLRDNLNKGHASETEVTQAFALVFSILESLNTVWQDNINKSDKKVTDLQKTVAADIDASYQKCAQLYAQCEKNGAQNLASLRAELVSLIGNVQSLIPKALDLTPVYDRINEVEKKIPTVPEKDSPEETRNSLELLQGDERLKLSAISGVEEFESGILKKTEGKSVQVVHGPNGINILVDGVLKGAPATYLNLLGGTGMTLVVNQVGERIDVTLNSSASGGGLSVLTATGAVDDSNVTFTFVSAPTLVVVNGTAYRDGHGVSVVGTTATLDNPVGVGGDIYALG